MNRVLLALSVVAASSSVFAAGPSASVELDGQYVNGVPGQDYAVGDGISAIFQWYCEVPEGWNADVSFAVGVVVTDRNGNEANPEGGFTILVDPGRNQGGEAEGGYTIPMYGNAGPYTITCTVSYYDETQSKWVDLNSASCEFFLIN